MNEFQDELIDLLQRLGSVQPAPEATEHALARVRRQIIDEFCGLGNDKPVPATMHPWQFASNQFPSVTSEASRAEGISTRATEHVVLAVPMPSPALANSDRDARIRLRMGWAMSVAASIMICGLVWYGNLRLGGPRTLREAEVAVLPEDHGPIAVPQPVSVVVPVKPIVVGATIATRAGERRRVTLADGSVLYLNQKTEVRQVAQRQLHLVQGEIYVEVAPGAQAAAASETPLGKGTFFVTTPNREVSAQETRFGVRAEHDDTAVVVSQGKVHVSGVADLVEAGQQLELGGQAAVPAPRVSHLLDWTRALMSATPLVPPSKHTGGGADCCRSHGPGGSATPAQVLHRRPHRGRFRPHDHRSDLFQQRQRSARRHLLFPAAARRHPVAPGHVC